MGSFPQTFLAAVQHFSDADNCLKFLAERRWKSGVMCPTCGRKDVTFIPTRRLWQCKTRHPKNQFSVKTGTILEDSPIGLDKWLPVIWLLSGCKNGISSCEVARDLGVTQKTAWFMLHRIRYAMQDEATGGKIGGNGGPVQVDETFIGGKARNMHADRRASLRRVKGLQGGAGKAVVIGALERGGKVRATVADGRKKKDIQPFVRANVEQGSEIHSDEHASAWRMDDEYTHAVVNHLERYVDGNVHTNGIENFWSLLKRGVGGTYVSVEPFHLFRYVDEQAFRYNNRKDAEGELITDAERFELLCTKITGKRLTYDELIAKEAKERADKADF